MKVIDQIYNTLVQTWNQLNITGSERFSILREFSPIPNALVDLITAPKKIDAAECRPLSDSDRILFIQQESGVMRALSHALVNISSYHYDHRSEKGVPSEGKISTCGSDPVGSGVCRGSILEVACPEYPSVPMILNPCVWKLNNEQLPQLLEQEPKAGCFEMRYQIDPDKIHLHTCVGQEDFAWKPEEHLQMEQDYQDVREGRAPSIARELAACGDTSGSLECLPSGKWSRIEDCYSLPEKIDSLHSKLDSLRDSSQCSLFAYEFNPDCIKTTVCEARLLA